MKKYARVVDEKTKQCDIGVGTNSKFYQSIGMTEQEVEQAYNGQWYLAGYAPEESLEQLKLKKREEINAARDAAEQGGFLYLNKVFDSDPISCQRMSCAAQAMAVVPEGEPEPTITWTCQDNTTIDLTPEELMGLVGALARHSNTCHEKATNLKHQIEMAETAEEVEKIKWENEQDEETDLSGAEPA